MNASSANPLQCRAEVQRLARDLITPVLDGFTPGRARVLLGANRALYGDPPGLLEGFARPLWGLAPLAAGGGEGPGWDRWCEGLDHGTDPSHPEYWGEAGNHDQRNVEMAALAAALLLAPQRLWEPLTTEARSRVAVWLGRINDVELVQSNWLFFRLLVNVALRERGHRWSAERIGTDAERLDEFYLGRGWYRDGPAGPPHRNGRVGDYYVPMAFHFYGLLYARFAGAVDPERSARYRERAVLFAHDFIHYFAANGAAVPFGRSLTYRFAQTAFWGALALASEEALPWGIVKGVYLRNLRWWLEQPILSESGRLTIGYAYPNLVMAESYTSSASPYWACKAFLPLALPGDHPFWTAEAAPLPPRPSIHSIPEAQLITITAPRTGDVVALTPGQPVDEWPRHVAQKYSKCAYSTRFGFSIPVGLATPAEGGFDSVLALSDDGGRRYRPRDHCEEAKVANGVARSRWRPWSDVDVSSWLIADEGGHVRVHRIRSGRPLWSLETSFASGYVEQGSAGKTTPAPGVAVVHTPCGRSWICDIAGGGSIPSRRARTIELGANSHLLFPLAVMPALDGHHAPGTFWLATLCGGAAPQDPAQPSAPPAPIFTLRVRDEEGFGVERDGQAWWSSQ